MSRQDWTDEKLFSRLLTNKSDNTYWQNVRELRTRATKAVFTRARQLATSRQNHEKKIGIDVLAQLGVEERPFLKASLELYFKLLSKRQTPEVLSAILYAIAKNNSKLTAAQVAAIAPHHLHADKNVRLAVVFALLTVTNKVAIDVLTELTTDKFIPVRNWATFGIGSQIEKTSKSITTALWNRVSDKDQDTRFEAIVGLAIRKDERVRAVIIGEIEAGNFGTLLFTAIDELGDPAFLPVLQQLQKYSLKDKTIAPAWLEALDDTIGSLKLK